MLVLLNNESPSDMHLFLSTPTIRVCIFEPLCKGAKLAVFMWWKEWGFAGSPASHIYWWPNSQSHCQSSLPELVCSAIWWEEQVTTEEQRESVLNQVVIPLTGTGNVPLYYIIFHVESVNCSQMYRAWLAKGVDLHVILVAERYNQDHTHLYWILCSRLVKQEHWAPYLSRVLEMNTYCILWFKLERMFPNSNVPKIAFEGTCKFKIPAAKHTKFSCWWPANTSSSECLASCLAWFDQLSHKCCQILGGYVGLIFHCMPQ